MILKNLLFLILAVTLASCATPQKHDQGDHGQIRTPASSVNLTGAYLGEGLFQKSRTTGVQRPAMRFYLEQSPDEVSAYYGVLVEYPDLLTMAPQYIATQNAPVLNKAIGYLNRISAQISAYKLVPGERSGTYNMYNLIVQNGKIAPTSDIAMILTLDLNASGSNPLAGATMSGNSEGEIFFPKDNSGNNPTSQSKISDLLVTTQYKLAKLIYSLGHLASTWRGNWGDLEGSYLSQYGRFKDGVLELYSESDRRKANFIKSNRTKQYEFTNPKSAFIEGDYDVSEPIPKMYLLTTTREANTASDAEMTPRIGLFLDVFDGSAPEAGSHLVTELAFINPEDPKDFLMYYEHPDHLKNVGVEPPKKK